MATWYFKYFFFAILAVAVLYLLQKVGVFSFLIFLLIALAILAGVWGWGQLVRKTTIYTITKQRVSEKRGILNTVKEQAKMTKITNITVERKLIERILGIGRINIDTAADQHSSDILRWWGIEDPYSIEGIIDGLRLEHDDEDEA